MRNILEEHHELTDFFRGNSQGLKPMETLGETPIRDTQAAAANHTMDAP